MGQQDCNPNQLDHLVKYFWAEFWKISLLGQVFAYIYTQMAFTGIAILQSSVAVLTAGKFKQPVGPRLYQYSGQRWVTPCLKIRQEPGQLVPVANCQSTAKTRDEVAVQVKVRVLGVKDFVEAVYSHKR